MDEFIGILILVVIIVLMCAGIVHITGTDTDSLLLQECQKSLPRDQYCKLIAVPENVK